MNETLNVTSENYKVISFGFK